MSKFSKTAISSNENSLNFIMPIIVLVVIGVIYIMSLKSDSNFANFILIGVGALTTIYWVHILKKMTKDQKPKFKAREAEAKNWVYDLIKGDNQFIFVAEVPGPDDKIIVRLIDVIL